MNSRDVIRRNRYKAIIQHIQDKELNRYELAKLINISPETIYADCEHLIEIKLISCSKYHRIGTSKGKKYYKALVTEYPNSKFIHSGNARKETMIANGTKTGKSEPIEVENQPNQDIHINHNNCRIFSLDDTDSDYSKNFIAQQKLNRDNRKPSKCYVSGSLLSASV